MKPTAYEGKDPYIFVSYAHKDHEAVYAVLGELQRLGYRFWYDEGIEPGSDWPENIARHLDAAAMVIAFITPASMRSETCCQEISFSLTRSKPLLSIMLEPTNLPLGMEMQLSTKQMIMRWNYDQWGRFIAKILSFPTIESCRLQPKVPDTAFKAKSAPASAAQPRTGFDGNATIVLDPEDDPTPAGNAQAAYGSTTPNASQWATATGRVQAGTSGTSATRGPNAAQMPLNSTGTVWAGSPAYAPQPSMYAPNAWEQNAQRSSSEAHQPHAYASSAFAPGTAQPTSQQPGSWTQATAGTPPATQQPYGYAPAAYATGTAQGASRVAVSDPQDKKPGKYLPAIIAAAAVAVVAIALLAFGPLGASGQSGCSAAPGGKTHTSSADLAEVVPHPPFMLEDLVSGNTDNTIAILEGFEEFQNEYDEHCFTADSDMVMFYTDISEGYSDTTGQDMRGYLSEHASSLPWRISSSSDGSYADLDTIKSGEFDPTHWYFEGYLSCPDPTSEDMASYVAELFDYDGIALYRVSNGTTSYRISGFAFSDTATLELYAYKDSWIEDGYWELFAYVNSMDNDGSSYTMNNIVYLCEDESHRSQLEDAYIVKPEGKSAVYQDAVSRFDEEAYEAQLHALSTSIGSDFDVSFDLADLVTGSPADTASTLSDFLEIVNTGTYSDGDEWRDVYYTASEDMGKFMALDVDGDGYTDFWDPKKDSLDSAPYYLGLLNEGLYLSREEISNGASASTALFRGIVPASEPSCEDVARYVKEFYAFDQIIIYLNPETETIEGYAKAGDTTAWIRGEDNANDPISTTDLDTYRIDVNVADESDTGQYDSFMNNYNNAALPDKYPDSYKE